MTLQCYAIEFFFFFNSKKLHPINNANKAQPKVSGQRHGGRGIDFLDVKDLLYRHHAQQHIKYDSYALISEEDLYQVQRSVSL